MPQIPILISRAIEQVLGENYYLRSEENKRAVYAEIKKQLPNMNEETMTKQATRFAVMCIVTDFGEALINALSICEDKNVLTSGDDQLPSHCYKKSFFENPKSRWPKSQAAKIQQTENHDHV